MKKTTIFKILGLLLLIIVASCSKEEFTFDSPDGQGNLKSSVMQTNNDLLPVVGCNEITYQLIAGQNLTSPAGTVSFKIEDGFLNVCFNTNPGWVLQEVHFYIGLLEGVPVNSQNIPNPGHFPYSATGLNTETYCYPAIPASVIPPCEEHPVILVHAVVYNPTAMRGETAWGYGCKTFANAPFNSTRWGYWDDCSCFEFCEEPETKYLTIKTFYNNAGENDWSYLSEFGAATNTLIEPYTDDWCVYMGVLEVVEGLYEYDLLYHGFGVKIGEVDITVTADDISVTTTMSGTDPLTRTYLFYGTMAQLQATSPTPGSCPDYGTYFTPFDAGGLTQTITIAR